MHDEIDETDALGKLGQLARERSAKWESLLLLGNIETLLAAREWHRLVGKLQRSVRDNQTDVPEWRALFVQAQTARTQF